MRQRISEPRGRQAAGQEGRGVVARTLFPRSQAFTYQQAWLRPTAAFPLVLGLV